MNNKHSAIIISINDIKLKDIEYDADINYYQFRKIVKSAMFKCKYKGKDTVFTYLDNKEDNNAQNKSFVLSKTDFTQLLIVLYHDFIVKFCHNTRLKQASVKTLSFRKLRLSLFLFFIFISAVLCIPYVKYIIATIIIAYYAFILLIKSLFLFSAAIKHDDFCDCIKLNNRNIKHLPKYTILVPIFKENETTIRQLIHALSELKYNKDQLDVKFLLEADDLSTIDVFRHINMPKWITTIFIPYFEPRTKPKACNVGALFAEGEFLTIFDAEDIPDKEQLLFALQGFARHKNAPILQASLRFYNYRDNFLTECFNIEYNVWFKIALQFYSKLDITLPLGGTSNHIKYEFFEKYGFWDSYNVTEDLELSVLASKNNKSIKHLNSNTKEWCVVDFSAFIKQRSRWLKGYLLTYLANFNTFKCKNIKNAFFFHITVGTQTISYVLIPYVMVSCYVLQQFLITQITLLLMYLYNCLYVIMYYSLLKNINVLFSGKMFISFLIYPFYFILHFISAWVALFEIFYKPFYWQKTEHCCK